MRNEATTCRNTAYELPLVSVIVPFYKQQEYLVETVESVLNEGYPHIELIIIDDGSPVPASSVLPPAGPWKLLRTENRGPSAARNTGFQVSSGKYLVFLDADDRLVPGAIASHVALLQGCADAAMSFGASCTINARGEQIGPARICRARSDYFLKLLEGNMIAAPGAAFIRRSAFETAGLFDEGFRMAEDYRLYLQLAIRHRILHNPRCVLERRVHGTNVSMNLEPMLAATLLALDKLQVEESLTARQKHQLAYGRRRWAHEYRPQTDFGYHLRSFYYDVRAAMGVSPANLVRLRAPRP